MNRPVLFVGLSAEAFGPIRTILRGEPYELRRAESIPDAWQQLEETSVVVATDSLPQGGANFLASVRTAHPLVVRVLILDSQPQQVPLDAVNRAEVYRIVPAPIDATQLNTVLRQAVSEARRIEARDTVWAAARQQQAALALLRAGDLEGLGVPSSSRTPTEAPPSSRSRSLDLGDAHGQRLSLREREIVEALGSGRRVKDIASDLIISTHTVRNHLKAIYRKLNVRSQFELLGLMARNH
ncbi:MAG TPA: DNA-binding response regulator [Polyangiaceae bacterium]|nr:DNA-binding response regulator [Polyangiaceae bacterium]